MSKTAHDKGRTSSSVIIDINDAQSTGQCAYLQSKAAARAVKTLVVKAGAIVESKGASSSQSKAALRDTLSATLQAVCSFVAKATRLHTLIFDSLDQVCHNRRSNSDRLPYGGR